MILAIDTCILLDILLPDPHFGEPSRELLKKASTKGRLIICEIVYAELAPFFGEKALLDDFLAETEIKVRWCSKEVLWEFNADGLITRDKRFYQKYFGLKIFEG